MVSFFREGWLWGNVEEEGELWRMDIVEKHRTEREWIPNFTGGL